MTKGSRLLKDILPAHVTYPRKFDILVIDEAHNVAPAAASQYALESQRTRLVRAVAPHFEHRLFLTATPHNGYQESFTSLLELLDDQRFARSVMPDERQLQRVMVRRLKTDLVDADGKPIYPRASLSRWRSAIRARSAIFIVSSGSTRAVGPPVSKGHDLRSGPTSSTSS